MINAESINRHIYVCSKNFEKIQPLEGHQYMRSDDRKSWLLSN
jgi:hypothetical protein